MRFSCLCTFDSKSSHTNRAFYNHQIAQSDNTFPPVGHARIGYISPRLKVPEDDAVAGQAAESTTGNEKLRVRTIGGSDGADEHLAADLHHQETVEASIVRIY